MINTTGAALQSAGFTILPRGRNRMTIWALPQFLNSAPRRRPGRPSQERYDYWTPEELEIVAKHKGIRGGYRHAAKVLGRTYQSVKAKGAKL